MYINKRNRAQCKNSIDSLFFEFDITNFLSFLNDIEKSKSNFELFSISY